MEQRNNYCSGNTGLQYVPDWDGRTGNGNHRLPLGKPSERNRRICVVSGEQACVFVYRNVKRKQDVYKRQKDGIGEGYTRKDHQSVANQLFACYAKVSDARALASVIGEEELSPVDKSYLEFGRQFEQHFINQGENEDRSIDQTLDLGWDLLCLLPKEELDRVDTELLFQFYDSSRSERFRKRKRY